MKYALILPDGAADEPTDDLDGRTPLEAARTPNIDWIAINGRQGTVVTVPERFSPGSDVATRRAKSRGVAEAVRSRRSRANSRSASA